MVRDFGLFEELTETSGAPGYEDRIREIVRREFEGSVDEVRTDDGQRRRDDRGIKTT